MKTKLKYILTHDTDPDKEKVIVTKKKKNINDITYKASTIVEKSIYSDVSMHEDGNGATINLNSGGELELDYNELVQLFCVLETFMRETGFVNLKLKNKY